MLDDSVLNKKQVFVDKRTPEEQGTDQPSIEELVNSARHKLDKKELVNHPAHYGGKDNPYEVVKIAEAWGIDKDAYMFCVLRYILRKDYKEDAIRDLKKAEWYIRRRIDLLEGKTFHVTDLIPPWEKEVVRQCGKTGCPNPGIFKLQGSLTYWSCELHRSEIEKLVAKE